MMRVAAYAVLDDGDNFLRFLKQYGVEDVVLMGASSEAEWRARFPLERGAAPGATWSVDELARLRRRVEAVGLKPFAMENPLPPWCMDRIKLGLPGWDSQIENVAATIRHLGQADIPIFGYHWMVNPPDMLRASWRTAFEVPGRGEASIESFDMAVADGLPLFRDRLYTEDEMWANYTTFIEAIRPVLVESGVKLALHPDDPPVEQLGGVPRLFRSFEGFERAMTIAATPMSGLNFCLGNWTAMGTDIVAAVQHFGSRGQILYGHVQGVNGAVPRFQECFLDQADCDFPAVLHALASVGFDGGLIPTHFPHTDIDLAPQYQGHAFGIGYVKGMLAML